MENLETKNSSRAAFPCTNGVTFANDGLTKREYFTALAMQAVAHMYKDCKELALVAVTIADETLNELEKPTK